MKRVFLIATALLCMSSLAAAQDCTIAAYGDPGGTQQYISWIESHIFSVYVVLFAESTVAAAAYSMTYPFGPTGMFLQARFTGPSGNGLVIDEPTGTNAALAECVIGFGGLPVVIDEYQFVVFPGFGGGVIDLGPNTSQHPDLPQYVTCADVTVDCEIGPPAYLDWVFPTEDRSFGAIKALFNN